MVQSQRSYLLMVCAVCIGASVPVAIGFAANADTIAENTEQQKIKIRDVKLKDGGVLTGQLLNPQGGPMADVEIQVITDQKVVASAMTQAEGKFSINGLRGGNYVIGAKTARASVRLWAPGTEPPAATDGALLVAPGRTVRGSFGGISDGVYRLDEAKALIAIPLLIGGAAIIQHQRQEGS